MIEEFVSRTYGAGAGIEKLAGDASERKFYRVRTGHGSFILMQCESSFRKDELPFINIWEFLRKHRFPVPDIHEIHPGEGIIILTDLGDELLQRRIMRYAQEGRTAEIRALCKKAIEIIVSLQVRGTNSLDDTCVASRSALDRERFLFELGFFYEHHVKGLLGMQLTAQEEDELKSWFTGLAEEVAGSGKVLCHRDFHSRNLVIQSEELYMTDFQDARLGPYQYDLASFLRDSYVLYDDDLIGEMLDLYRARMRQSLMHDRKLQEALKNSLPMDLIMSSDRSSPERIRREFDLCCLQRNIKAIGTFAFQSRVRKNDFYLQYIPATARYIKENLDRLSIHVRPLDSLLSATLDHSLPLPGNKNERQARAKEDSHEERR